MKVAIRQRVCNNSPGFDDESPNGVYDCCFKLHFPGFVVIKIYQKNAFFDYL